MQNAETIVCWSTDPDTSRGGYSAQESALWRWWLKEMGVQFIYVDPFNNYTSVKHADKWIGPRMGTDTATLEAIAYVWITEGTYDKEYWHSTATASRNSRTTFWALALTALPRHPAGHKS